MVAICFVVVVAIGSVVVVVVDFVVAVVVITFLLCISLSESSRFPYYRCCYPCVCHLIFLCCGLPHPGVVGCGL